MSTNKPTHCGYRQVYQRDCTNPTPCPYHSRLACTKCQGPATGSCSEIVMGFFCCEPLCNNCQHDTPTTNPYKEAK